MSLHEKVEKLKGKVITARGPITPEKLGKVMMHEHLHSDLWDWDKNCLVTEEKPCSKERFNYLKKDAVPLLKKCHKYGMGAFVEATMPPWRAWPDVYRKISELSGVHIIICTGFYREIEQGTYFVKKPDDAIWPFVRNSPVEKLTEMCISEITEGIRGTKIKAGAIKLGSSQAPMTSAEKKAFIAGARAQRATGVHITTHCTRLGAETSQLTVLENEGVDLRRVVIGHTAWHLSDKSYRSTIIEWMKRGANFLPTNLGIWSDKDIEKWKPLVEAVHEVFDKGHGDKLFLGLDSGYTSESCPFTRVKFLPEPPWLHLFEVVLPAFRKLGLTEKEEDQMLRLNPMRVIPVQ